MCCQRDVECSYYVQYQKWVPTGAHTGEKKTFTVELLHLCGFADRAPKYQHYITL